MPSAFAVPRTARTLSAKRQKIAGGVARELPASGGEWGNGIQRGGEELRGAVSGRLTGQNHPPLIAAADDGGIEHFFGFAGWRVGWVEKLCLFSSMQKIHICQGTPPDPAASFY